MTTEIETYLNSLSEDISELNVNDNITNDGIKVLGVMLKY